MSQSVYKLLAVATGAALFVPAVHAFDVRITIENLASNSPTGLYLGPVWLGAHNGTFDLFNAGTAASAAIELLAETGNSSLVQASFAAAQPLGWSTVLNQPTGPGPGIFAPGTSNSLIASLDPMTQRYLSWGSMVVPSNDTFLANENPMAAQLFDSMGNFAGVQSWTIFGSQLWDSGTEVNDPANGPAFLAGSNAALGAAENGVVHVQPLNGLDSFIGQTTAAGTVLGETLNPHPLFRISIAPVPEPSTYGLMASAGLLALVALRGRRFRRKNAPSGETRIA